jgi:SNF family Na+-dependent transporter
LFFGITILVNLLVLSRGLSKGIEFVAKIGMPVLLLCAVALVARVLSLPDEGGRSAVDGLAIYWQPEWRALIDSTRAEQLFGQPSAAIWLAAAGQIFFTLSVGSGAINTYASYLTVDDDIALTGLATVSTNEFCEVVLGGTLAIPAAFLFFGLDGVMEASSGSMGLAFITMPEVFAHMPLGASEGGPASVAVYGTLWFGLLFVAGITSSLALSQPTMAFLQGAMGVGLIILICVQPVILLPGVLDEIDYWAGTFGLVVFSTIEVILFMWVFGPKKAWAEIHKGSDIQIPKLFKIIMTFVTPAFLLWMLYKWGTDAALPILSFEQDPGGNAYTDATRMSAYVARALMLSLLVFFLILVRVAAARGHFKRVEQLETEDNG